MNCYHVKTKHRTTSEWKDFYVSAPNYTAVESVVEKEKPDGCIVSIRLLGECFIYSSLYKEVSSDPDQEAFDSIARAAQNYDDGI